MFHQSSPTTKSKLQVKKVVLPPLMESKIQRNGSFKISSPRSSKSPSISTVPSIQNIKLTRKIVEAPKFQNANRRQTFSVIESDQMRSPRIMRGQSMTKLLPSIDNPIKVRGSVVNNSLRNVSDKPALLSDLYISKSKVHKLELKLKGFSNGDKTFDIELNQMSAKFGNTSLVDLIIKGKEIFMLTLFTNNRDKESKLKDSGVAQLIFNFQKNGRRIIGMDLQLNFNDITDIGAKHIGNGLTYLPNLRSLKLNLGNNKFGRRSADCIAKGIKSLTNINNLEIDITNYGMEFKMEDEGVNLIYNSISYLKNLKSLKLIVSGQQITTTTFDNLIKALQNKPQLVSLEIDKDFGFNEEYIGISGQQFQQLLLTCPNLVYLKICRLSFTKNTKKIRTEFFLSLFKQEYLTDINVLFTNGYHFLNNDQSLIDYKKLCEERKKGASHLIGFNKLISKFINSPQRLTDDLYDINDLNNSMNDSFLNDDNYHQVLEENYDSFN